MNSKKTLSVLLSVIWFVQLLIEVLTFGIIWKLDMLPALYLTVVTVLLMLLWLLVGGLLFLGKRPGIGRRVTALVLVVLIVFGCTGVSGMVIKLDRTMNNVTGKTEITTVMMVYVRADDPAEEIQDAANYTFAVLQNIGQEKTQQAMVALENKFGAKLNTVSYEFASEMADALYSDEVDAILINAAYAATLEDLNGYENFATKTKVLHKMSIVELTTGSKNPQYSENPLTTRPVLGGDKSDPDDKVSATAEITNTPFVVYLSGNDTRSTTLVTGRSDVNILAVVNPETKQILLVNTPRDYYVPHPLAPEGQQDKLTHLGNDGIACSIQGLETLYDERIDFYAQINFTGFETLVDAIGGITVYFDSGFTALGITEIYAGENYLNGEQALHVARDRGSFVDGDHTRGRNQMKVIEAVMRKLVSGAIITNYTDILNSLEGMFVTDFTMDDLSKLVKMQLSDLATWNIQSYAVTGPSGEAKTYTAGYLSVVFPDEGSVAFGKELIDRVIAGEVLTDADVVYPG